MLGSVIGDEKLRDVLDDDDILKHVIAESSLQKSAQDAPPTIRSNSLFQLAALVFICLWTLTISVYRLFGRPRVKPDCLFLVTTSFYNSLFGRPRMKPDCLFLARAQRTLGPGSCTDCRYGFQHRRLKARPRHVRRRR